MIAFLPVFASGAVFGVALTFSALLIMHRWQQRADALDYEQKRAEWRAVQERITKGNP